MNSNSISLCSQCLDDPPSFDQCFSAYLYEFPVNRVLQAIKYQSRIELINPIAKILIEKLNEHYYENPWPEAIIPVPLHETRLRQRGCDQALLLAKAIRRQLNLNSPTLDYRLLHRSRVTTPQHGLDIKARHKNLRQAFHLHHPPPWQHVALVDDVVTTGATVNEIARLLKRSGIKQVDVWSIARTPNHQYHND